MMKNVLRQYIKEVLASMEPEPPIKEKVAACVLIISSDGRVLAVSRKHDPTDFGLPGGKVEPGEEPWEAARRECREETGLEVTNLIRTPFHDELDDNGYRCITFKAVVDGEINTDEAGVVRWVEPGTLMAGSFGPYNTKVLRKAGLI
jgi:8-oxo-dGTP pyrophosphatase MutT (NUDIX family)